MKKVTPHEELIAALASDDPMKTVDVLVAKRIKDALESAKASDANAEVWRQRAIFHGWSPDKVWKGWQGHVSPQLITEALEMAVDLNREYWNEIVQLRRETKTGVDLND